MKKILLVVLSVITISSMAQEKVNKDPKLFGYVRSWYEGDLLNNQSEFLVKMARLGIKGNVNEYASYRLFVDFTRLGKLKTTDSEINGENVLTDASATFSNYLLDATAVIKPLKGLSFTVGQFKVPFSTDNLRSGAGIAFVNRPLHRNATPGLRDIGFMGTYSFATSSPLELQVGLFNGSGQNKSENDKSLDYSTRAVFKPVKGGQISANYYAGKSSGNDVSHFGFGANYKFESLFIDGEYVMKNVDFGSNEIKSNAFFIYALYNLKLDKGLLTYLTPAIRFGQYDPNSDADDDQISRFTIGLTLEFAKIDFAHFRVNYEKYDYANGADNPEYLIMEVQVKF